MEREIEKAINKKFSNPAKLKFIFTRHPIKIWSIALQSQKKKEKKNKAESKESSGRGSEHSRARGMGSYKRIADIDVQVSLPPLIT